MKMINYKISSLFFIIHTVYINSLKIKEISNGDSNQVPAQTSSKKSSLTIAQTPTAAQTSEQLDEAVWARLFDNYDQRKCSELMKSKYSKKSIDEASTSGQSHLPTPNNVTLKRFHHSKGFGDVAYLFDHLDEIFQNEISTEFERIWNEAKKIEVLNENYPDIYELDKMLTIANNMLVKESLELKVKLDHTKMSDGEITMRMKKVIPEFDYSIYKDSLNLKQIDAIVKKWNYFNKHQTNDLAKFIMDKYDMDGDGRLNIREFILFTINNNKYIMSFKICKNCYNDISKEKLDPIFDFMDCEGKGLIATDHICEGLSYLKRKNPKMYDMFYCKLSGSVVRTSSCNDFILNSFKMLQGHINKDEFRSGLLIGYWDRQVGKFKIYKGDEINLKSERWSKDGKSDLFCDILDMFSK